MSFWISGFVFLLLLTLVLAAPSINDHAGAKNSTTKAKEASTKTTKASTTTTTSAPTQSYTELLAKIGDRCITNQDYEEAYGKKSKAGVVKLFFQLLIQEAYDQIGVEELRRVLHLKEQSLNLTGQTEEEYDESLNKTLDSTQLAVFQQRVRNLQQTYWAKQMFTTEEITSAVEFVEKKFPELRQAFRVKFKQQAQRFNEKFDNYALLDLFRVFVNSRIDVAQALKKADTISTSGDILPGGAKCTENFEHEKE